jgi:U32 family peptidase
MQFNTFVTSSRDLDACLNAPNLEEVLLEPALLSRQGTLSAIATQDLAKVARKSGLRPVLVWDALMPEQTMQQVVGQIQQWDLSAFTALRVCDPGAAVWVKQHLPEMPLQLIVEAGNHNLEALRGWCAGLAPSLDRLILSIELPEATLMAYCQTLSVSCEVLGAGQILLFYSPRSLLTPHLGSEDAESSVLQTHIVSTELPNRLFPTVETAHGTLMFFDKDQFILDRLDGLRGAGCHTIRIDLRHFGSDGDSAREIDRICQQALADPVIVRSQWPRETQAPFFKANRTTNFFPRLKSKLAGLRQETCLAESIAGEGKQYVVFQSLRPFQVSDLRCLKLPTGETLVLPANLSLRSLDGAVLETLEPTQIFITDWIKKGAAGALLMGDADA